MLYWFCHTSTWICYGCTYFPTPETPSLPIPFLWVIPVTQRNGMGREGVTISLGYPSDPAPSILYPASNLDWRFISYIILCVFQCHSPKSSRPLPLPQNQKVCSVHLHLFCCLANRVIVTIFLNLWAHGPQHARLPSPLLSPKVCSISWWVSDAIQPSHPLSSPSPLTLNLSHHQGLFSSGGQSTGASVSISVLPMNIQGWLPLGLVSSVVSACPTLCDPMDCSMPGFPVRHQLPEFT